MELSKVDDLYRLSPSHFALAIIAFSGFHFRRSVGAPQGPGFHATLTTHAKEGKNYRVPQGSNPFPTIIARDMQRLRQIVNISTEN